MAWKPREKPLTLEEARELARKELAQYFFGNNPGFAWVSRGTTSQLFPLDDEFLKVARVWLFAELFHPSTPYAIKTFKVWFSQYRRFNVEFLFALRTQYTIEMEKLSDRVSDLLGFDCPVVVDPGGQIATAVGVRQLPTIAYLPIGSPWKTARTGEECLELETEIQKDLRKIEPGLPLITPQARGAEPDQVGIRRVSFDQAGIGTSRKNWQLVFEGKWEQRSDCMSTSDADAKLKIKVRGRRVEMLCRAEARPGETSKLIVTLDDRPIIQDIHGNGPLAGEDMALDELGQTGTRIVDWRNYRILARLDKAEGWLEVRFPGADRTPIMIYTMWIVEF